MVTSHVKTGSLSLLIEEPARAHSAQVYEGISSTNLIKAAIRSPGEGRLTSPFFCCLASSPFRLRAQDGFQLVLLRNALVR
jgi:hypothetical protein